MAQQAVFSQSKDILAGVLSITPNSAYQGDIGVAVTIELDPAMAPPTFVNPLSAELGTMTGYSVSRNNYTVYASFDIPVSEAFGYKDVIVTFPGPTGNVIMTLDDGFEVLMTGTIDTVIYVDIDNLSGPWDGTSWASAFKNLQDGIDAANNAGGGNVWVADGTYKTTQGTDRNAFIELKQAVFMYGGFNGTETDTSQRDFVANVTIISGDIGTPGDISDNAYHVIIPQSGCIMDGFTVTGGNANGETYARLGGGMYLDGVSPTIRNCIFTGNHAEDGGAIYIFHDSKPDILHCIFDQNSALLGGAVVCRVGGAANITFCDFTGNFSEWRGGAVHIDYGAYSSSPVTITNCTFTNNSTNGNGGGIYTDDLASQYQGTYITVDNCQFTGNTAAFRGGGISNFNENIFITISDCDFTSNTAGAGGNAIANDYKVNATISNCTFASGQDVDSDATCNVTIN
ncbi:MAG: right-handed parallel beta-helix repeat-containing protein [Bacteroidota bacterium]